MKINNVEELLEKYDNFMFDCDGVVWLGDKAIEGIHESLAVLRKHNKNVVFITNNSSSARLDYVEKFKKLNIPGVTKEQIYPTSYSAVLMVQELGIPKNSKIWVLGEDGLEKELKEAGYIALGVNDKRLDEPWDPNHELLIVDPEVKAVIVGSSKALNYLREALTLQYLFYKNKSLPFIGTNIDKTYPGPNGIILPAGGSLVYSMANTASREFVNVGKPSTQFLDIIIGQNKFDKERTLMIGDTLYTDIKFGNDGKLGGTLLVLSGGTKEEDLKELGGDESLVPTYVTDSFGFK